MIRLARSASRTSKNATMKSRFSGLLRKIFCIDLDGKRRVAGEVGDALGEVTLGAVRVLKY